MSEKVHPIGDEIKLSSTPFTNTDFNLVLIELKAIRNEVAALKSSHTAEPNRYYDSQCQHQPKAPRSGPTPATGQHIDPSLGIQPPPHSPELMQHQDRVARPCQAHQPISPGLTNRLDPQCDPRRHKPTKS